VRNALALTACFAIFVSIVVITPSESESDPAHAHHNLTHITRRTRQKSRQHTTVREIESCAKFQLAVQPCGGTPPIINMEAAHKNTSNSFYGLYEKQPLRTNTAQVIRILRRTQQTGQISSLANAMSSRSTIRPSSERPPTYEAIHGSLKLLVLPRS
jgi:hypothetical protein